MRQDLPAGHMRPDEAIVLAGGFGTRLRAVVSDVPKPLAPVAGRPFLAWLLDTLAQGGIRRVVLATGYLGDMVEAAIGPTHAGMDVRFLREEAPLGTGGALWAALALTEGERVFALNGDTWVGLDLAAMAAAAPGADLVFAVREVPDRARYGSVELDGDRLVGLREKSGTGPGLINAGTYLLRRDLPAKRPHESAFSFEAEILERPDGLDVRAFPVDGRFIDIGTPEDFARAQTALPAWVASAG